MNTLQSLIDNGIGEYNAKSMISNYSSKINKMNGVYIITDITYDFNSKGHDVTLKCTECGREIHRIMINGRNKWSELIKTCPCQKEKKIRDREAIPKKIPKIKKTPAFKVEPKQIIKFDESYIGKKNNFLEVIGISRLDNGHRCFVCKCDCGNIKNIEPVHWERGIIKSCGCMHGELNRIASTKHGYSGDRLYVVYLGMKRRCLNEKSEEYENYGGRGIKICQEWLGERGFENFRKWAIQNGYDYDAPRGQCTIDRIDVNGNYEPDNYRWTDLITQANNKRPSSEWKPRKMLTWTIDGETKARKEWCKIYGIGVETVLYRINHKGMTVFEALTTQKEANGRPRKYAI